MVRNLYFKPKLAAFFFFTLYMKFATVFLQQFVTYDKPQSATLFAGSAIA